MKNKNELCQKSEYKGVIQIPAELTAEIVGCSASLVNQVRRGERKASKGKGAMIAKTDDLLTVGTNALINEVKRIVKLG